MALVGEHLSFGLLVAIVGVGILAWLAYLVWRRVRTEAVWEKGKAGPLVRESVQRAVRSYRRHLGSWPAGKAELDGKLDADERTVQDAGLWDCRLVSTSRDGRKARYKILISGHWSEWDAHSDPSPKRRTSSRAGKQSRPEA